MTKRYPAPPNWPLLYINRAEWAYFEAAGCDMRMFSLVRPIPRTLADDLRAEDELHRRRFVHHTRPKGPLTLEEARALHVKLEASSA